MGVGVTATSSRDFLLSGGGSSLLYQQPLFRPGAGGGATGSRDFLLGSMRAGGGATGSRDFLLGGVGVGSGATGSRDFLLSGAAGAGVGRQPKYQKHTSGAMAGGGGCSVGPAGDAWKTASRLVTSSNRSMPRLNAGENFGQQYKRKLLTQETRLTIMPIFNASSF